MRVEPDKVLALMRRLEARRDIVQEFIRVKRDLLVNVPAPGADPCSERTVAELGKNGLSAIVAAEGYVVQLQAVVEALADMARLYGLVEDVNESAFRWVR
ncbi:hypothetical protein [Actinokineospora sp.]|uniref:hypothetical protein n=1 Tax=Actinokineospora sp. TaxID=1872133 RepID=UPI004037868F